jgi:hypothetical protein
VSDAIDSADDSRESVVVATILGKNHVFASSSGARDTSNKALPQI